MLEEIRCLLLDLDGTVYIGGQLIPGALRLRDVSASRGIDVFFLTNNSSRSVESYSSKITAMGWPVTVDRVLSSSQATAGVLKKRGVKKVYVVGTSSLAEELDRQGLIVCGDDEANVDHVVVGFDTSLTYNKLQTAARHLRKGTPMISTNPDLVCPIENDEFIPDCAAISACLMTACGVRTEYVGKPEHGMLELVEANTPYRGKQIAMVGDRLYTDVKFAANWGLLSVLVLSGETKREDITADDRPDLVLDDVGQLADMIDRAHAGRNA
ncbi:MAG: HAD-IIA family hydrolase [Clostridia bacterium]|nr:HAD-IIA family hydrolase [Clostridia bacterium]